MPPPPKAQNSLTPRTTATIGGGSAALILACFFLSGLAGLIYQVLWLRMIEHLIGSAPFAVAAVLTVFMGGLALGSFLAGRMVDGLPNRGVLLTLYGMVEILIGLYALVLPFLVEQMHSLYVAGYAHLWPHPWLYTLYTFGGCLVLLIIPTALMGTTLPVLCRYYINRMDTLGTRSGRLYSLNTLGAAMGALLCGFVLIPWLGINGTLYGAVCLNLVIGTGCMALSRWAAHPVERARWMPAQAAGAAGRPAAIQPPISRRHDSVRIWGLVIFAVSGFCAMACEVFWTRLIGLIIGPTTYAFSLVVATFIIGLAAGSMLFGWLADRIQRDLGLLHLTQLCAALLALMVSQVLGNSQFFFAKVIHAHQHSFGLLLAWQTLLLFTLLLGPTLFWGAAFPLVGRICTRALPTLGRSIGNAYAVNTIGAIIGAFGAGFVLVPLVGKELGLRLIVAMQWGMAGLGVIVNGWRSPRPIQRRLLVSVVILAGLALAAAYPAWQSELLSRGWYRDFDVLEDDLAGTGWTAALIQGNTILSRQRDGREVLYQSEGTGGFTSVEQVTNSLGDVELALYNSGKADASSHGDLSTQTLSGHIPMLFHPHPQKVMVLGLASGMTAGEVLLHPVARLDILEINEQVVTACRRFFSPYNRDCLNDPRTRLMVQDGRNHLALTRERYDVIISEPSNPWMAGLASLYTLDFFRLVQSRLTHQGVFAQWIQSYEMDWETFRLLGRTFTEVFPNGVLIQVGSGDYLLLGFAHGAGLNWDTARHNLHHVRRSDTIVIRTVESLAHLLVTEDLPTLFGPGLLHTDDRPRLEYAAPRRLYSGNLNMDLLTEGRRRFGHATRAMLTNQSNGDALLDLIEMGASVNLPLFTKLDPERLTACQRARYMEIVNSFCGRFLVPGYCIFRDFEARTACAALQASRIRRYIATGHSRAADHYNLGLALTTAGELKAAEDAFEMALAVDSRHPDALMALGLLQAQSGRFAEARDRLQQAVNRAPTSAVAYRNLGMVAAAQNDLDSAVRYFSTSLALSPNDVAALNELGLVRLRQRRTADAVAVLAAALEIDPRNPATHHNLGLLSAAQNQRDKALAYFQEALRLSPDNANVRRNIQQLLGDN